jgi:hypothetical protein
VGYVETISSSDKRSAHAIKSRRTITTGTRSHASLGSQRLTKQVSTQENNPNTLTT